MSPAGTTERRVTKKPFKKEGVLMPAVSGFNPKDKTYQYWKCRGKQAVFIIEPSLPIHDPRTGSIMPGNGLSVRFRNGHWNIDRNHPRAKLIEERLRSSDTFRMGRLFCMDDVPEGRWEAMDPKYIGEGPMAKLNALGIGTPEHRAAVVRELEEINDEENQSLKTDISDKDAEIAVLKKKLAEKE